MLGLGTLAQTAATIVLSTPAFLIPLLHTRQGVPLSTAGLLASSTTIGMVLTLVAWGALADRAGERWVISGGIAAVAVSTGAAALTAENFAALTVFFVLAGMASASANAASGRLVVGWFPPRRRGLAMGIRQMCQPLGVAVAALVVPPLAESGGVAAAILFSTAVTGVLAVVCALVLRDAARSPHATAAPVAAGNPYRAGGTLLRIHLVSILLVVPQFTISIFGLVWMITEFRLPALAAGAIVGLSQFVGAVGRIGVGVWSDRVGSRMRPLRLVAFAAVASMVLLAVLDLVHSPVAIVLLIVATTISVADNGLAFAAVAEIAGPRWSGRALGAQNTGQYLSASIVGPVMGLVIGVGGFPAAFLAAAACALVATPLVPAAGDGAPGTPARPRLLDKSPWRRASRAGG
ncbi:MFS transporter [Galbitalea soli]|uniref:MFS transporter n=2 Tax=Galbitalea soli TaxID=1268042 RepID=A0A7C9PNP7_9MICO|nr:MFS transporter [Galbitalea soli]NEM91569.1 MFS transporter [Galbitalea soli]